MSYNLDIKKILTYNIYVEGVVMQELEIKNIKSYINNKKIKWTEHCANRMFERDISKNDVINTVLNGKIIEYYENAYPFPSCLILGLDNANTMLHVCVGVSKEFLYIITAYYPDDVEWEEDRERRKQ